MIVRGQEHIYEIDIYIGKQIRKKRLELGISCQQLADIVGVSPQQVRKYEKGYNHITASRVYQFSEALQENIIYFFPDLPVRDL